MKNYIFFLICLLGSSITLLAQESKYQIDSVVYITKADKARLIDKQAKFVFKSNLTVELKIAKDVSLIPFFDLRYKRLIGIESRYYYNMRKRINQGLQSNNVSGPYVSIFGAAGERRNTSDSQVPEEGYSIGMRLAQQQRILNKEYYDIGISIEHSHKSLIDSPDISSDQIRIDLFANYGFMFGKKYDIDSDSKCAYLRCYSNRKSAWRVNLKDLASLSGTFSDTNQDAGWIFYMRPNITYERKIANSSFSIEQEINSLVRFGQEDSFLFLIDDLSLLFSNRLTYKIGGKYYYNMKKRIREGKSGNNLSGMHFILRANHTIQKDRMDGFIESGIGYQKELMGNVFLEVSAIYKGRTYGDRYMSRTLNFPLVLDFRISYILN